MNGSNALAGMALMTILLAMGLSWVFRVLLLKQLQSRFPEQFSLLGSPRPKQLTSLLPRHQGIHVSVWKYLWGGAVFQLKDGRLSMLALAALLSDIVLVGGVAFFLWAARQ